MKPLFVLSIMVMCGFNSYIVGKLIDDAKLKRLFFEFSMGIYAVLIICLIASFF